VVDVFCGQVLETDVAVCGENIVGIGTYKGLTEVDCKGAYVCPGFMEGHIHIESSMLCPQQFVKTVLPHGTTTVVCDPHEIANVAGIAGIKYFLDASQGLPCAIYAMAPSCVPATHLESSGAKLSAIDLEGILQFPQVIGVAEMMNFPGVIFHDPEVMSKVEIAARLHVPLDGHAPGLSGKELQAYIGSGIMSDHECSSVAEAQEKLSSGMYLFIREGSTAKNLEALLPVVTRQNSQRCLLVTDDCHPDELLKEGHLDRILRKAITLGLDPITAIQMVTINVANYFGLRGRGAVAPGYRADLVLFEDLEDIRVKSVFAGGVLAEKALATHVQVEKESIAEYPEVFNSVHVAMDKLSFVIPAEGKIARVIRVQKDELLTDCVEVPMESCEGFVEADVSRDILKIAVVERHHATGNIGLGFVQGIGLRQGAIASTIGHDSHNISVIGASDEDMLLAVQTVVGQGGGLVVVCAGEVVAHLRLDVAGLMATTDAATVAVGFESLLQATARQGVLVEDPFMLMSFLALPVIPHLKMTDCGLVDVDSFQHTSLWV
jgi:adenine deaminase